MRAANPRLHGTARQAVLRGRAALKDDVFRRRQSGLCISSRANGHFRCMERFRWTRARYVAALAAGAITCLVVGMLVGVLASGGHPKNVFQVITDAPPASARDLQSQSRDHQLALPTQPPTTVTSTITVTAPARTVTTPASTVTTPTQTVTETETETTATTDPASTSTQQTTSP